jgi:hypothetical protein
MEGSGVWIEDEAEGEASAESMTAASLREASNKHIFYDVWICVELMCWECRFLKNAMFG